jgi:hypothetical protein
MSDFGAPVAQNVDTSPTKGLETIKSLMGLKSQQLTIQGQQSQNQSLQATAQKDQQAMQERQAFQKMMQTGLDDQGNSIKKANGEPDETRVLPAIGRLMPLTGQAVAQSIIKTVSDKVGLQSASTSLDASQRQMLSGLAASNIGNPQANSKNFAADVDNLVSQHPEMANAANYAKSLAVHLDNIPDTKMKDKAWQHLQGLMQSPSELATAQQSSIQLTQGKSGLQPVQTNPRAPGGVGIAGPTLPQGMPPGAMVLSDASGKQFVYDPQSRGLSLVGGGSPGAAPTSAPAPTSAAPPQGAPTAMGRAPAGAPNPTPSAGNQSGFTQPGYPGWGRDIEANQGEIRGIRAAGDAAPQSHNINQQILKLSQNTSTGPLIAWAREHVPGLGGIAADDYQELSKYLEKNAINNMSAMGGPPSDARLSAASAANGSTHFNPGALQAVTKFNDATTSALEKYRQGADATVGLDKPDYTKLAKFKSVWAKNFNVDIFRLENAVRDGDKQEQASILNGLSKEQRKDLQTKRRNLNALATTGELPK